MVFSSLNFMFVFLPYCFWYLLYLAQKNKKFYFVYCELGILRVGRTILCSVDVVFYNFEFCVRCFGAKVQRQNVRKMDFSQFSCFKLRYTWIF